MGRHAAARVPHDERPARARPWRRGSPDPVPNSAVKPAVAESTAAPGCGRIGSLARAGRFLAPWGPPSGGPSPRPRSNPGAFSFAGGLSSHCLLGFSDVLALSYLSRLARLLALLFLSQRALLLDPNCFNWGNIYQRARFLAYLFRYLCFLTRELGSSVWSFVSPREPHSSLFGT